MQPTYPVWISYHSNKECNMADRQIIPMWRIYPPEFVSGWWGGGINNQLHHPRANLLQIQNYSGSLGEFLWFNCIDSIFLQFWWKSIGNPHPHHILKDEYNIWYIVSQVAHLSVSAGARTNCYTFITMVTGSSRSTIVQVSHQMKQTGGEREPPTHGMKKFWQGSIRRKSPTKVHTRKLTDIFWQNVYTLHTSK